MTKDGAGRHCAACDQVIYDFSQMSDRELVQFFTAHKVHCGRFHAAQLNRDITPPLTRRQVFIQRFYTIAATLLAVISLKALPATATYKKYSAQEIFEHKNKQGFIAISDSVLISGTVKDENGNPLAGAKVESGKAGSVFTNTAGQFSCTMSGTDGAAAVLVFSYDSMVPVVRNYHAAMGNTVYDIVLVKYKNTAHSHIMGIMPPPWSQLGELPSLLFHGVNTKLSSDNKSMLAAIAEKLKNNPQSKIIVKAYRGQHIALQIFKLRLNNIKIYLIEKEGISANRILTSCEEQGGDIHTVDILAAEEYE